MMGPKLTSSMTKTPERIRRSRMGSLHVVACLRLLFVLCLLSFCSCPQGVACASATDDDEQKAKLRSKSDLKVPTSLLRMVRPSKDKKVDVSGEKKATLNQILIKAGKKGLGGGLPGAVAGVVQVLTLMWLRTVINYQSRYGASFRQALVVLFRDGGIPRFYRGLSFALLQAPLSRFVSTAANDGVETFLASLEATKDWGPGRSTIVASLVVGVWRMFLMPLDTCKTVLQVDSVEGFRNLMRRVRAGKVGVLYSGAIANALSAIVGHYPWYVSRVCVGFIVGGR